MICAVNDEYVASISCRACSVPTLGLAAFVAEVKVWCAELERDTMAATVASYSALWAWRCFTSEAARLPALCPSLL